MNIAEKFINNMKYWICVKSDFSQCLYPSCLVKCADEPDVFEATFEEITEEQYNKLLNED